MKKIYTSDDFTVKTGVNVRESKHLMIYEVAMVVKLKEEDRFIIVIGLSNGEGGYTEIKKTHPDAVFMLGRVYLKEGTL